jgi:hypothetical protein
MPASRKKNTTVTAHIASNNDETIDINVSDTSDGPGESLSQQVPAVPPVDALANNAPAAIALAAGMLAPLLPSAPTARTNRAHDIDYFFSRGSKTEATSTICKPCR